MSDIPEGDDYKYNDDDDCGENGVCDRDFDGGNSDSDGGEGGEIGQGGGQRG